MAISAKLTRSAFSNKTLGDLGTLAHFGNLGNLSTLSKSGNLGILGWQSLQNQQSRQEWQSRQYGQTWLLRQHSRPLPRSAILINSPFSVLSAMLAGNLRRSLGNIALEILQARSAKLVTLAILAIWAILTSSAFLNETLGNLGTLAKVGNLGALGRQYWQTLQSRHSRRAISTIFLISPCHLPILDSSLGNSVVSGSTAFSGDTLGDLGKPGKVCIAGNPNNLGSVCIFGWHCRQSRPSISVAISATSNCKFGNLSIISNSGKLGILGSHSWHSW